MTIEQFIEVYLHMFPHTLSTRDCTDLMVSVPSYFSLLSSNVCMYSLFNLPCSEKVEGWFCERDIDLGKTCVLCSALLNSV